MTQKCIIAFPNHIHTLIKTKAWLLLSQLFEYRTVEYEDISPISQWETWVIIRSVSGDKASSLSQKLHVRSPGGFNEPTNQVNVTRPRQLLLRLV
ncbi:MAG: hypothetical protein GY786_18845 [Proteobacteria bacterium]|nr:hypothetical protein [Pseudomonadota bacterium]